MVDSKFSENLELLRRSQEGDRCATERLVTLNGGLVSSIAVKFIGRGTSYEDLLQIGYMGLLKAIRTFDLSRGCAFSTYAVPLVFGEIRRFLRDDGLLKVSRSQKRIAAMIAAERDRAMARGENDLRLEELASRCGITPEEAATALEALAPVSSLSELLYGEENGPTLESTLCDEEETTRSLDRLALSEAIDKLPEQRRKIITLRYFRDFSQEQTARALGLTQVKVSREEKKILAFLRQELG